MSAFEPTEQDKARASLILTRIMLRADTVPHDPEDTLQVALTEREGLLVSLGLALVDSVYPELNEHAWEFRNKVLELGVAQGWFTADGSSPPAE